jgi:hypothetical protein
MSADLLMVSRFTTTPRNLVFSRGFNRPRPRRLLEGSRLRLPGRGERRTSNCSLQTSRTSSRTILVAAPPHCDMRYDMGVPPVSQAHE